MPYPSHNQGWIHPFQAIRHNNSSSAEARLLGGMGNPFSVRPAAHDDLICRNT